MDNECQMNVVSVHILHKQVHVLRFKICFFFLSFKELAIVSLKVVSRKRRRKCTLKSYDRFTNK